MTFLSLTVPSDVQRDDQQSSGLQTKPQWLHGWSVGRIRGMAVLLGYFFRFLIKTWKFPSMSFLNVFYMKTFANLVVGIKSAKKKSD